MLRGAVRVYVGTGAGVKCGHCWSDQGREAMIAWCTSLASALWSCIESLLIHLLFYNIIHLMRLHSGHAIYAVFP